MAQETFTDISKEDLRQAQKIMLYIMKKIHEVCVKHNIKYWLDYGTLLGAIRHDGFIPWDDDLDICMMREDYEKFSKVAQDEFGDEFFWQTHETDPAHFAEFGRVRLTDSLWLQELWKNVPLKSSGIFVDIFPLDPFPEDMKKVRRLIFWHDKIFNCIISRKVFDLKYKKVHTRLAQIFFCLIYSKKRIRNKLTKIIRQMQKYKQSSPLVSKICMDTQRDLCDRSMFDKLVLHKFEDAEFYIPARYDERLKMLFNNYMQLPPEDKRYGHHGILKYDFGKYAKL